MLGIRENFSGEGVLRVDGEFGGAQCERLARRSLGELVESQEFGEPTELLSQESKGEKPRLFP